MFLVMVVIGLGVSYCTQSSFEGAVKNGENKEQTVKPTKQPDYSAFVNDYQNPDTKIGGVYLSPDGKILTQMKDGATPYVTYLPPGGDSGLVSDLLTHHVSILTEAPKQESGFSFMGVVWFLVGAAIIYQVFSQRQMKNGGAGGAGNFTKSKANCVNPEDIPTRFVDVAGVDAAVKELAEFVDFLKNPARYAKLGAKMPRGILMDGPPGCGKTYLAKALAKEAGVPFYEISGSDFVEMFVGAGAGRVRSMFEEVKKLGVAAIIFIDEIDAVGGSRGMAGGNNNEEREHTLMALLKEMDGFNPRSAPIIIVGATNRPGSLDKALLRPGRFDCKITMQLPDLQGREKILIIRTKNVDPPRPLEDGISLLDVARGLTGFSGADLENLANLAALSAVRAGRDFITANDFELMKDKVTMGDKSGIRLNDKDKRIAAYHEAGHAIVGYLQPNAEFGLCTKVSIMPRGRALGITNFTPPEDSYSRTKSQIKSTIMMAYGGRVAEEIIFGPDEISTGASNDIQRITSYIMSMIMQWGMSDTVGQLAFASESGDHLNQSTQQLPYSQKTAEAMDEEKKTLAATLYRQTKETLLANEDKMHAMAEALLKWETIEVEQIDAIMAGREPPIPKWFVEPTSEKETPIQR